MYTHMGFDQTRQITGVHGRTEQEQHDMETAFERALADARTQTTMEADQETLQGEDEVEEIIRDPKGDFDAVWESLRPEAERLGKLAEWEKDFSQVSVIYSP